MATILDQDQDGTVNGAPQQSAARPSGASRLVPSLAASSAKFWRRPAARRLRRGGLTAAAAWDAYWSKRKSLPSLARRCRSQSNPLAWGWDSSPVSPDFAPLVDLAAELSEGADVAKFARPKRRAALRDAMTQWLDAARDGDTDGNFALAALAAAHVLHEAGAQLDADLAWRVVDFLFSMAEDAQPWHVRCEALPTAAVAQQMLAGELPLTLAYCFPEMAPLYGLRRRARRRLTEGLAELLDGKGLVRGAHISAMRSLTACWTRAAALGRHFKEGPWTAGAEKQYRAHVRQAIRWTDASGRSAFASPGAGPWTAEFLTAVLREGGRGDDVSAARALLRGRRLDAGIPKRRGTPPAPSYHSEWSGLALMRTRWSPRADSVAVDYSGPNMQLEVSARGAPLFAGAWSSQSRVNGRLLPATGPWEQVCWFTDPDIDFLEFSQALEGGARLERQILLARCDGFLMLVDHLQNTTSGALEHVWQLPAAPGLAWRGEEETRDAVLLANKTVARLLPGALPEWRIDPRVGDLSHADGCIRLEQRAAGQSLACPTFIDLNPRRARRPCTWRQLTVAEALKIVPADAAVAYRFQCGDDQWLYYRSQGAPGNRTVLGQNTSSEFLTARFLPSTGEIQELVQIL